MKVDAVEVKSQRNKLRKVGTQKQAPGQGEAQLLDEMIRRPVYPSNPPLLSRHICIRLPAHEAPYLASNHNLYKDRLEALVEKLNAFVKEIEDKDAEQIHRFYNDPSAVKADKTASAVPGATQYQIDVPITDTLFFRRQFPVEGIRLGVRLDIHKEYLTLTYVVDIANKAGAVTRSASTSATIGQRLLAHVNLLTLGDVQPSENQNTAVPHANPAIADWMYEGCWNEINQIFIESSGNKTGGIESSAYNLGEAFAEFRGFAISVPNVSKAGREREARRLILSNNRFFDRVRGKLDDEVFNFVKRRPYFFGSALGINGIETSQEFSSEANVALCGVLNGAAIYGTTLGARSKKRVPERKYASYFLIYNGASNAQLGRLVRRVHVLSELKSAALMDIDDVRKAKRDISYLSLSLSRAELQFKEGNKIVDRSEEAQNIASPERLSDLYRRYSEARLGLSQSDMWDADNDSSNDIIARIERSRYYAQSFRERLQDLRIQRIEGWQQYDDYARRALFMSFDYISSVGEAFDQVAERLDRLTDAMMVSRLDGFNQSVDSNTRKLSQLQHMAILLGDFVGAAAFTYYAGVVSHDFLNGFVANLPLLADNAEIRNCILRFISDKWPHYIVALIAFLVLRKQVHTLVKNREKKQKRQRGLI